jgi:hypothetical protein
MTIGSEQAWKLKLLDARRSDENFVLFEVLLKPGSVGGPPRALQIGGHHLEYDDVVAAVLRFSPCRLSIVDCDPVELALQFFRQFSELLRRESAAKVIGER